MSWFDQDGENDRKRRNLRRCMKSLSGQVMSAVGLMTLQALCRNTNAEAVIRGTGLVNEVRSRIRSCLILSGDMGQEAYARPAPIDDSHGLDRARW